MKIPATIIIVAAIVMSAVFFTSFAAGTQPSNSIRPFATGGPDAYGYRWFDSNPPPPQETFAWIDISTTGINIGSHTDDGEFGNFSIGFDFEFYGRIYDEFWIGNNGGVLFTATSLPYTNGHIPTHGYPYAAVLPFWDDLYTGGDIYYETRGSAPYRYLIVQWQDINHFSYNAGTITFQVVLYETTNDIKFQYLDVDFGHPSFDAGISATVGIQCENATIGLEYSYNTAALSNNLAIRFSYMPPRLNLTATANPYVIEENSVSQISITVLDARDRFVQGATVDLNCTVGIISPVTGTTGAYGDFNATYTAPSVSAITKCTIMINATSGPNTGAAFLNITIIPSAQAVLNVHCSASPSIVYSANNSAITVQIDYLTNPVANANVNINVSAGTVSPSTTTTNTTGGCSATYTAPTVSKHTICILNVTATAAGYTTGYSEIQLIIKPPPPLFVSAYAIPSVINSTENSTIQVIVTDGIGGVAYAHVTLNSAIGGTFLASTGPTDLTGNFTTIYTAPSVYTQMVDTITVSISKAGFSPTSTSIQITINPTLTVTVVTPNGGERWYVGREYDIEWYTSGAVDAVEVQLKYSIDGGRYYHNITGYQPESGTYRWRIPSVPSSINCFIKAIAVEANTLRIATDTSDAPFEIIVVQFMTIWYDGFEINRGWTGYYVDGTQPNDAGEWERRIPEGAGATYDDPDTAYNGSFVVGTDLSGLGSNIRMYEDNLAQTYWLTSPPIDCTGYVGVALKFWRWLGVYYDWYDHAYIEVSNDGTNWNTIWENIDLVYDGYWVEMTYDISTYADDQPTVYIRFGIGPTGSTPYMDMCGWNIDDVVIEGVPIAPIPIISAPNGKEVWYYNSTYSINWTILSNTGTPPYNIDLYVSTDDGQTWSVIVTGLRQASTGFGSYQWHIKGVDASLTCKVKIVVTDSTGETGVDTSNENFEIRIPPLGVELIIPNGGEKWYTGGTYTIKWRTEGGAPPYSVDLQISSGGGAPTSIDTTTQPYEGLWTYDWTIPYSQLAASNYRIIVKVTDSSPGGNTAEDSSDADFEILITPLSVTLNQPTGGELWYIGDTHTINWTISGGRAGYEIKVELSTDGGLNWAEIDTVWQYTEGYGGFDWVVSGNTSQQCIIRIEVEDRYYQTESAQSSEFEICALPVVSLITPNGGEIYYVGSMCQIYWLIQHGVEPYIVDIYITVDDGLTYTLLGRVMQQSEGQNTYEWSVNLTVITVSDTCKIRVDITDANSKTHTDISDNYFAVALPQPVVSVTSPAGGETWYVNNVYQIRWYVENGTPPYEVVVELSTDGGLSYLYLIATKVQLVAGDASYTWLIDSQTYVSEQCVIRISVKDANKERCTDSSGIFTIKTQPVAKYGTLKGRVIDAVTNEALADVIVILKYAFNGTVLLNVTTNTDGDYIVQAPPAIYNLTFTKDGYAPKELSFIKVIADRERFVPTVKLLPVEEAEEEEKPVEKGVNIIAVFGGAAAAIAVVFLITMLIIRKREKSKYYYYPPPMPPTPPSRKL